MSKRAILLVLVSMLISQVQAQPSLFSRTSLRSLVQENLRNAWEIYFAHKANYGSEDLWSFRQLAVGLAEVQCFDEAFKVLKVMPKPTKIIAQSQYWNIYREVAVIAAKMGRHDLAKRLGAKIPNFVGFFKEPEGSMQKSAVVLAISENLEKLPPEKARQRLREAVSLACQINDNFRRGNALCALAKAAVKFAPQEAKTLLVQVLSIAEKCPEEFQRLNLLISVALVINCWDKKKAKQIFDRAMQIALRQPEKHNRRDWSIWWVIKSMMEAGLWDEAIKAANLLLEMRPQPRSDIPAYASMLVSLPPTKWEALKAVAEKLAEKKLFTKALQVADTIKEPRDRAGAYISIAKFIANPETEKACQLLWQAMDIATKEVDLKINSHLVITIVEVASKFAPQEAIKLALKAAKPLQRLDSYSASQSLSWLAVKVASLDTQTAQKLFEMALKSARNTQKPDHKMVALEGIVYQMCQAKFFNEAQKLLPEIERASLARGNVSPGRWCLSMRQIIVAMVEAGQAKRALALLPKLSSCRDEDRFEAILAVAKGLARSDIRIAEKLLRDLLKIARSKWREYERQKQRIAELHGSRIYPPHDAFNLSLKVTLAVAQIVNQMGKKG